MIVSKSIKFEDSDNVIEAVYDEQLENEEQSKSREAEYNKLSKVKKEFRMNLKSKPF